MMERGGPHLRWQKDKRRCAAEFRWPVTEAAAGEPWAGPESHTSQCQLIEGHDGLHFTCWLDEVNDEHYETEWAQ